VGRSSRDGSFASQVLPTLNRLRTFGLCPNLLSHPEVTPTRLTCKPIVVCSSVATAE
jgi:hypothetical protein